MIWTIQNGHEKVAKLLLEDSKIDLNVKDDDGKSALILAARNGNHRSARILLQNSNINVNVHDEFGQTPLILAAKMGCQTHACQHADSSAAMIVTTKRTCCK